MQDDVDRTTSRLIVTLKHNNKLKDSLVFATTQNDVDFGTLRDAVVLA